jgi:hypothetical protein
MTSDGAIHAKFSSPPIAAPEPEALAAAQILRGVQRLLRQWGMESIAELPLGNGRRADVVAIGGNGEIHVVEIKSSVADFNSDHKWPDYLDYCDRFSFAVSPAFPADILPVDAGLILADAFGGELVRCGPTTPLAAARRKAMLLSFARVAAMRLHALRDPTQAIERL